MIIQVIYKTGDSTEVRYFDVSNLQISVRACLRQIFSQSKIQEQDYTIYSFVNEGGKDKFQQLSNFDQDLGSIFVNQSLKSGFRIMPKSKLINMEFSSDAFSDEEECLKYARMKEVDRLNKNQPGKVKTEIGKSINNTPIGSSSSTSSNYYIGSSSDSSTSGSNSDDFDNFSSKKANDYVPTNVNLSKKALAIQKTKGGRCGLSNLGNTCFMNSGLQCLLQCRELIEYVLGHDPTKPDSWSIEDDINYNNKLGSGGRIAHAFVDFVAEVWSKAKSQTAPARLKQELGRFYGRFAGCSQQDSHELVVLLLDKLHEDFKRSHPDQEKIHYDHEKDELEKKAIRFVENDNSYEHKMLMKKLYNVSCKSFLTRDDSRIADIFYGTIHNKVKCLRCNRISHTFHLLNTFQLPISKVKNPTLDDCMSDFVKETHLKGNNKYYCSNCKDHCEAILTQSIVDFPKIAIIQFKRFKQSSGFSFFSLGFAKDDKPIKYPVTGWDVSRYCETGLDEDDYYPYSGEADHDEANADDGHEGEKMEDQKEQKEQEGEDVKDKTKDDNNNNENNNDNNNSNERMDNLQTSTAGGKKKGMLYDLIGVSVHGGSLGGGHYTAYTKQAYTDKWLNCNDSWVSEHGNPLTGGAYLLFYRRRD